MAKQKDANERQLQGCAQPLLPAWADFPDIELYMDQVLSLMTRYLGAGQGDDKPLTASMVNNYVKIGLVPAPVKKRYLREHLAYLLFVCVLKPIMPLASIRAMLDRELAELSVGEFYEKFRIAANDAAHEARAACDAEESPALHAALRSRAHRDMAVMLSAPLDAAAVAKAK